jgi:hypothetical protein
LAPITEVFIENGADVEAVEATMSISALVRKHFMESLDFSQDSNIEARVAEGRRLLDLIEGRRSQPTTCPQKASAMSAPKPESPSYTQPDNMLATENALGSCKRRLPDEENNERAEKKTKKIKHYQ